MSEQEQPDRIFAQLEPLESALRTYIGRDKNGPFYSRVDLYPERDQLSKFLPNIVRCILSRVATTDPRYIGELAYEFSQTGLGSSDQSQPISDNSQEIGAEFVDFASNFYTDKVVSKSTGLVSASQRKLYINEARENYADNPLIGMAREVNTLLQRDELDNLGNNTVCAITAVVGFLHHHREERLRLAPPDPTSAA